jgi:hypothetical protein
LGNELVWDLLLTWLRSQINNGVRWGDLWLRLMLLLLLLLLLPWLWLLCCVEVIHVVI